MHRPILNNQALNIQPWFLVLLACYTVLELSFNHRLLELAGDLQWKSTAVQLNDIEIWGACRLRCGFGLVVDALAGQFCTVQGFTDGDVLRAGFVQHVACAKGLG